LSDATVWLSIPTVDDADAIARVCRHSSIGEWTTVPVPYHRLDAVSFVETTVPQGWREQAPTWAVRLAEDGDVVGMVSLHAHRHDPGAREIGYWLAPGVRGRGLMTRAVRMACEFGFAPDGLRLERIEWRAFAGNRASAAVVARAGFVFEGVQRGSGLQRGRRRDEWVAGRLATDPATPVDWPAEYVDTATPSPIRR
jgi:RimJ/RimL family protein N-acetyltransferase